jgi:membrane-bound lytic murein transglycosylase B
MRAALVALAAAFLASATPARAADAAFTQFIVSLWPEAQAAGVSRETFDRETKGLEPDYKLPDLILPGRPATGAPSQAEFVQVPADYIKEASIARLAEQGQKLMAQYRPALNTIESRFKVPATIVLAIWGRETDYGRYTLPYDLIRVLGTQAYVGRRKEKYHDEFILGLKMLSDGVVTRKDMRSRNSCRRTTTRTASISTATARPTSGIRCRMRSPRPRSSSSTRAGRAVCVGPMR